MKKCCFHPPKNIIVGTLAAMLWVAVFPFWLLGESTPLNALVSGEVPLWDALTRLVMQDYSNITRAKWDGMLLFTMLTLLLTIPTLFRREKRRKLPLMLMLLFLLWTGLSCFFGSHAGEMNAWGVPTVLWGLRDHRVLRADFPMSAPHGRECSRVADGLQRCCNRLSRPRAAAIRGA